MLTSRQDEILPKEKIESVHAMVVGCGAIGKQVATQLACMGVPEVTLVDFDTIELVNISNQGWRVDDRGTLKVCALKDILKAHNPNIECTVVDRRFDREAYSYIRNNYGEPNVVFLCLDNMDVRKEVYKIVEEDAKLIIDGRMGKESMRVITVPYEIRERYWDTWYPQSEGEQLRCTEKGTIYLSNIVSGFMVNQMGRWLRDVPTELEISMHLLPMSLIREKV